MDNEEFLKQLKQLAKEGHEIGDMLASSTVGYDLWKNKHHYHEIEKWKGIATSLLKYRFGESSKYLNDFLNHIDCEGRNRTSDKYYKENVKAAASTLEYIYEILVRGLTEDLFYKKQILTFSDLLNQAYYFLDEGFQLAAGIYGRLVLETTIREYAAKCNVLEKSFDQIIIKLRTSGKISKPLENSLRANYEIGSWAAHNNEDFKKMSDNSIKEFLDFIRDKVLTLEVSD